MSVYIHVALRVYLNLFSLFICVSKSMCINMRKGISSCGLNCVKRMREREREREHYTSLPSN